MSAWSGASHNTLLVDGREPYPAPKPYYDSGFRQRVSGPPPDFSYGEADVVLRHGGYRRRQSVGQVERHWHFNSDSFELRDSVEGQGTHRITRRLFVSCPTEQQGDSIVINGPQNRYRLTGDASMRLEKAQRWQAYGVPHEASVVVIDHNVTLPWRGVLRLEVLRADP